MSAIKKNINAYASAFDGKTGQIKYWVDIQQNQIEIKIYSSETIDENVVDSVILWDIIKLSELQKKPGFVDQTLWTRISEKYLPLVVNDDDEAVPQELHEATLVDMFGESLTSKPKSFTNLSSSYVNGLYSIFVASNESLTSSTVRLTINPNYEAGFEVVGPSASSFVDEHVSAEDLISAITLSSTQTTVSADSSITVNVSTDSFISEVYLEPVCGILNKTRVKLTNGQGSFKILTTGLEVGDEIRVKAGHRKYTGIASYSKTVS